MGLKINKHRPLLGVCICISTMFFSNAVAYADVDKELEGKDYTVGIEAVGKYDGTVFKKSDGKKLGDLKSADTIAMAFTTGLWDTGIAFSSHDDGQTWKLGYKKENKEVKASHFIGKSKGGDDSQFVDNVDLCIFVGHGFSTKTCEAYTKGKHKKAGFALNTGSSNYTDNIACRNDMRLGTRDLEWMVTFTCNFLNGEKKGENGYGQIACGVRAICGFTTQQYIVSDAGGKFIDYAESNSVKNAWFKYAVATNSGRTDNYTNKTHTAAVFTTYDHEDDWLWGVGTQRRSDPKPYKEDPENYVLRKKVLE